MIILKTKTAVIPANETEVIFTDVTINNDSIIEVYYDDNDVYTVETSQTGNAVSIVTSPHSNPVGVKLLINNVNEFSPYDDSAIINRVSNVEDDIDSIKDNVTSLASDVNDLSDELDGKQELLIAGENITIEDNVISSNGGGFDNPYGTYQDFLDQRDELPVGSAFDTISDDDWKLYSTEEIIIGKWINGKPIYRKVYTLNMGTFSNGLLPITTGLTNIKKFINYSITLKPDQDEYVTIPYVRAILSEGIFPFVRANSDGSTVVQIITGVGSSSPYAYATDITVVLEYIKTTD